MLTFQRQIQIATVIGVLLGFLMTYVLFTNVQWYHDMLVWSWTNPWMWAISVPAGIATAVLTDK